MIAVEASPCIFTYLSKNVSANALKNVRLINKALFDKDDEERDFYSPDIKYGKGSLLPVFSKNPIKVMTKKVNSIVRDYSFQKVDTIKIDVEGFEYFVFCGADELLGKEDAPDIVFEFVDWAESQAMGLLPGAAQELLLKKGYRLYRLEKDALLKLDEPLKVGASNLFASKKWG